jgi:hypothetical protein
MRSVSPIKMILRKVKVNADLLRHWITSEPCCVHKGGPPSHCKMSKKYTTLSQFPVLRNAFYARSRYSIGGTTRQHVRNNSTMPSVAEQSPDTVEKSGMLFVDSLFPVRFGIWEWANRHWCLKMDSWRQQHKTFFRYKSSNAGSIVVETRTGSNPHKWLPCGQDRSKVRRIRVDVLSITHARIRLHRIKDGGAFVKFKYMEPAKVQDSDEPLETPSLEAEIQKQVHDLGGVETWTGNKGGDIWLVRGKPWREVCELCSCALPNILWPLRTCVDMLPIP